VFTGQPFWDKHPARALLKKDILDSIEGDDPVEIVPKTLWSSRPEYQEFELSTFRNHIAQMRRYYRQFPGWQFSRNREANEEYHREVERMRNEFEKQSLNSNTSTA
jgi:hypothetical protein